MPIRISIGLLERRLLDHDRLEAALERGVALDVLAVLVERGRADALQLAARERRLEDVRGVDRALGRAGADERVQLVDEQHASLVLRSSSMIFLSRSSNSPRYLVPATSEPMSSVSTRLPSSVSGTSPATMRWARPSAMAVLPTPGSPISAGLFLVRRDRIWMTRSISFSRPMTGSSLPARTASVRLMPSWSTVGVLLARLVSVVGPALRRLGEDADDLVAHLVEVDAEALEHAGGDALALADQAEQQVLGADVVVAQPARLVDGELDDLLGARGQADLADDRAIAAADDELDGRADLGQLDAHVLEDARGDALALADEAEQQVLRADVVVVEPLRFVLGKRQDLARAFRELVEAIHMTGTYPQFERLPRPSLDATKGDLPADPTSVMSPQGTDWAVRCSANHDARCGARLHPTRRGIAKENRTYA